MSLMRRFCLTCVKKFYFSYQTLFFKSMISIKDVKIEDNYDKNIVDSEIKFAEKSILRFMFFEETAR